MAQPPEFETPGPGSDDFDPRNHTWDGDTWWTPGRTAWWDGHHWQPSSVQKPSSVHMSDQILVSKTSASWKRPLVWIAWTPLATVILTLLITDRITHTDMCVSRGGNWFVADYWCPPVPIALALSPGVLNLIPILWLRSADPKTRLAAVVGLILGALRLVLPVIGVFAGAANTDFAPGPQVEVGPGFPNGSLNPWFPFVVSLPLWLATFVAIAVIGKRHLDEGNQARSDSD